MQKTVYFGFERNIGAFENAPCHFLKIFSPTFVPTELLRTRRAYYNRKLRGSFHRFQIFEFPLFKLCSIAEVQIFGKGIAFPIACIKNTFLSPNARRSVEIYKMSLAISSHLFQSKMCIEGKGLNAGKYGIISV